MQTLNTGQTRFRSNVCSVRPYQNESDRCSSQQNKKSCSKQNLDIGPKAGRPDILFVHSHPLIKSNVAISIDLPNASHSRCDVQSSPLPIGASLRFVNGKWTRSYQRHFPFKDIHKLRSFVEAAFPKKRTKPSQSRIILDLERWAILLT